MFGMILKETKGKMFARLFVVKQSKPDIKEYLHHYVN